MGPAVPCAARSFIPSFVSLRNSISLRLHPLSPPSDPTDFSSERTNRAIRKLPEGPGLFGQFCLVASEKVGRGTDGRRPRLFPAANDCHRPATFETLRDSDHTIDERRRNRGGQLSVRSDRSFYFAIRLRTRLPCARADTRFQTQLELGAPGNTTRSPQLGRRRFHTRAWRRVIASFDGNHGSRRADLRARWGQHSLGTSR